MSKQQFDIDKFNAVIQADTGKAICSEAKALIARAVAAGKGETPQPEMRQGQIWELGARGELAIIYRMANGRFGGQRLNGRYFFAPIDRDDYQKFVANDLKEYLANGGVV